MAQRAAPAKHWCFTWNDADDKMTHEDIMALLAPHCDYVTFQEEKGAEGTKHYQGYAEFAKVQRPSSLAKITAPHKPHWEKRQGTRDQAREYARKEDTRVAIEGRDSGPWEGGEKPWSKKVGNQGERKDLNKIALMVKEGATDQQVFEEHPGLTMKYLNHIQKVRFIFKPRRQEELQVVLLYGTPGTGKTHAFWNKFPNGWGVPVGKDLWFTGYAGEPEVLIDDFAGNIGLTQLLQILDKYPVQLSTKGYHCWWCPNVVCITTNCHPCNWYNYKERQDSYAALERRISQVFIFKEKFKDPEEADVHNFFNFQKVPGRFNLEE